MQRYWIWRCDAYKNKHEGKKKENGDLRRDRIPNRIAVFHDKNELLQDNAINLEDEHKMTRIKVFYKKSYTYTTFYVHL